MNWKVSVLATLFAALLFSCGGPDNGKVEKILEKASFGKEVTKADQEFLIDYDIEVYNAAAKKLSEAKDAENLIVIEEEIDENYPYMGVSHAVDKTLFLDNDQKLKDLAAAQKAYNTEVSNADTKYGEKKAEIQAKKQEVIDNILNPKSGK